MRRWLTPHPKVRTWVLFAWWTAMFLLTHLPGIDQWKPKGGWPIKDPDKVVHFILFGTWAGIWVWVLTGYGHRLTLRVVIYIVLGAAFYAALDEITQGPVGRTPDVYDWVLDMVGCIAGLGVARLFQCDTLTTLHEFRKDSHKERPMHRTSLMPQDSATSTAGARIPSRIHASGNRFPRILLALTISTTAFAADAPREEAKPQPYDPKNDYAAKPVELPAAKLPDDIKLKSIFDGKTLKGWKEFGGGKWSVEEGDILGQTGDGNYGWLIYDQPVADFVLELECKHDEPGNSGIQIRSHLFGPKPTDMVGYQIEFDPRPDHGTGGLYDEGSGGRGWIKKPDARGMGAMKPMEWNKMRIEFIGDHLRTWVNGVSTLDIRDHNARSGIIALQVHAGKDTKVRFRNVKLANLGDGNHWKPLFDGKDLGGWHTQGTPDTWRVEDGQIIGELVKPSPYCYLATDSKYGDFEFKGDMKFDSNTGNSGVFFRCSFPPMCAKCGEVARDLPEDTPAANFKCPKCGSAEMTPMPKRVHIHGPQSEFALKDQNNGFVYDARGHGWVNVASQNTPNKQNIYHFKDWNQMRIVAKGNHILTWINGYLVTDLSDYDFPKTGILALQLHQSTESMKVRFKNLEIREVK